MSLRLLQLEEAAEYLIQKIETEKHIETDKQKLPDYYPDYPELGGWVVMLFLVGQSVFQLVRYKIPFLI